MSRNEMVTLTNNFSSFGSSNYNGWTVADIRDDALVQDQLNLSGEEIVQIRRGGGQWEDANNNTTVNAGDELLFTLPVGVKG